MQIILISILFSLFGAFKCAVLDLKPNNGTFFYFAYGSNLLSKRIHYKNPSAVFYSSALLQNYRLDFNKFVDLWNGAGCTIVPDNEASIWGTVWLIDSDQMDNLDEQEGVNEDDWYFPLNVTVTTPKGQQIVARTYQEKGLPEKIKKGEDLPWDRRPSSTYLQVIALGAIESGLPSDYIAYLFSFPTNGYQAVKEMRDVLGYPY